jgi:predicted metal-binding membrane protein
MGGMPMPGGGTMWSFLGTWVVMMVAMMLPSFVPVLWRYHQALARISRIRPGVLTALVSAGYFFVWTVFGVTVFPTAAGLARSTPMAVGVVVLIAGGVQFTAWKARRLACCREAPAFARAGVSASFGAAWRHGVRLGLECGCCCANLMAILLVVVVMDLRAMAVVTAAITIERLAPAGERVARAIGAVVVGAGLSLIARAAGLS